MTLHQHTGNNGSNDGRGLDDPFAIELGETSNERSNVIAFMLGGVVIAGGLLGFLYLDDRPTNGPVLSQNDGYIRMDTQVPKHLPAPPRIQEPVTQ